VGTVSELERRMAHITKPITVAVMGCVVNGPGEAKEADIAVAGGGGDENMVYIGGVPDHKVKNSDVIDHMSKLIEEIVNK